MRHQGIFRIGLEFVFVAIALVAITFSFLHFRHRDVSPKALSHPAPNQHEQAPKAGPQIPILEIKSIVRHGKIYEIEGLAESGASVMINGEHVPVLFENSSFRYFLGPLPDGITIVTITEQNDSGEVNTKQLALTIP